jgi:hypothetical protein
MSTTRLLLLVKEEEADEETTMVEKLRERRARLRDELAKKMSSLMTLKETETTTTTTREEEDEEEEVKKRRRKLLLLAREKLRLVEKETERRAALVETLEKALEEETRRNDSMEMNTREREERARREARAMAKRAKKNENENNNADDVRELIKIRLKSCEFELRCERSRVFRDVKNVFALVESAAVPEATKTPRGTKNSIVSSYGKRLPDVDAFAYSSKQQQHSSSTIKEDMDAFIEAIYGDKNENEHEIAATLSMMNRFVTLLGRYSFCPSLHRSTPGVTNATEIWKPVDSTTTSSSSRNFERGGKESFDDDDDDYARDEAVKADEFFRKTFGSEDVVVYGDIASPECEILPLYYTRIASKKCDEEHDTRTQKKRFLRALRLLQKSCEIVASHLAAEVTELATSDIFDEDKGEEDEHQYRYTRRLMRELSGNINNNNNTRRSGPFCSLLVAFEALVEIAERKRLRDLYYCSSASSSSSISCEELFSSEDEDNEGLEPVVVVSSSLRNIDNTAFSKTTTTKMKSKKSGSRTKRQLAEKSKSMIKSVWGFVAEPTKKLEKNLRLTRVLENNDDDDDDDDDENEEDEWDVVDVPHTLIRKTSSSNSGDSKTKTNIRLPPPPCEEENLDHYVRAMFTDKQ